MVEVAKHESRKEKTVVVCMCVWGGGGGGGCGCECVYVCVSACVSVLAHAPFLVYPNEKRGVGDVKWSVFPP